MFLIFVGQGYPRKLFNLEHFPIYGIYQQTLAPLHVITTIATGYHTPGSAPTYIFSIFNQDFKPPESSYSLLPEIFII